MVATMRTLLATPASTNYYTAPAESDAPARTEASVLAAGSRWASKLPFVV
jgi:hypothetical protein